MMSDERILKMFSTRWKDVKIKGSASSSVLIMFKRHGLAEAHGEGVDNEALASKDQDEEGESLCHYLELNSSSETGLQTIFFISSC